MPLDGHTKNVDIMKFEELDFTINPEDRSIIHVVWDKAEQEFVETEKHTLMQYETNSTKMVFDIPRYINGHDMRECNIVQIHYRNSGATTSEKRRDIYNVTDLEVYPNTTDYDGEEVLRFSWDISNNATQYAGNIEFVVHFICTDAGANADPKDPSTYGVILYNWSTAICEVLQVMKGMNNNDLLTDETPDYIVGFNKLVVPSFDWVEDLSLDPTDPGYGEKNILQITNKIDGTVVESLSLKGEQGDNIELRASDGYIQWKLCDAEDAPENWTNLIAISSLKGEKGDTGETPKLSVGRVEYVTAENPVASIDINNANPASPVIDFRLPNPPNDHVETIDGTDVWMFAGTSKQYEKEINDLKNKHGEAVVNNMNILSVVTDDYSDVNYITETIEKLDKNYENIQTSLETTREHLSNTMNTVDYLEKGIVVDEYKQHVMYNNNSSSYMVTTYDFEFPEVSPIKDELVCYQYYDANGNPLYIYDNNGLRSNTYIKFPESTRPQPSNDSNTDNSGRYWTKRFYYDANGTEPIIQHVTEYKDMKNKNKSSFANRSAEIFLTTSTYSQLPSNYMPKAVFVTMDGETKPVELRGFSTKSNAYTRFKNKKNDLTRPDQYDGDGIMRDICCQVGVDAVYGELHPSGQYYLNKLVYTLYGYICTSIYSKGFQGSEYNVDDVVKFCNKETTYDYDPLGIVDKSIDIKVKSYYYEMGAPSKSATLTVYWGASDAPVNKLEGITPTYEAFEKPLNEIVYPHIVDNVSLGDYIMDPRIKELYKVLSVPNNGIAKLLRISRQYELEEFKQTLIPGSRKVVTTKPIWFSGFTKKTTTLRLNPTDNYVVPYPDTQYRVKILKMVRGDSSGAYNSSEVLSITIATRVLNEGKPIDENHTLEIECVNLNIGIKGNVADRDKVGEYFSLDLEFIPAYLGDPSDYDMYYCLFDSMIKT